MSLGDRGSHDSLDNIAEESDRHGDVSDRLSDNVTSKVGIFY